MKFAGIIAEYDPFHNGHAAQLAAVRAAGADCVAVCLSSGAVQRGGVPILPESVRVRAALGAGADIVVALPAPYACATAEQFAAAGVHLLAALGCDTLAFGAETPDAAALLDTARLLDGEELNARIRQNLATGMTYAAARAAAADALHRAAAHADGNTLCPCGAHGSQLGRMAVVEGVVFGNNACEIHNNWLLILWR